MQLFTLNSKHFLIIIVLSISLNGLAQNSRLSEKNAIGWYAITSTFDLKNNFSLYAELQIRRDNIITDLQQNLMRVGVNYKLNPKLTLRVGYANIETFNYGTYSINPFGKNFTEHRAYQMLTLNDKSGKVDFIHRFMLEQRWTGRYSNASLEKEDNFTFTNRFRYMFRLQMPLKGNSINIKTPYAAIYDEIFVGFGKNVNENVFDQNRLGIVIGYKFSPNFKIEAGFLNQTVQLSREINNQNVFQYNSGIVINTAFDF